MTSLIEAAFTAPLVGIRKRWPHVLHAVEMPEVVRAWPVDSKPRPLPVAACGVRSVHPVVWPDHLVPWPPAVKALPEGYTRCRACHEATGRKRPRSTFVPKEAA